MPAEASPGKSPIPEKFIGYWAKMLRAYAGVTPEAYEALMKEKAQKREDFDLHGFRKGKR